MHCFFNLLLLLRTNSKIRQTSQLHIPGRDDERGIAVILALIMLLIMSVIAVTISFVSNIDFLTMSHYKRGQEAFLATERCVAEARRQFEIAGIAQLFFQLQGGVPLGIDVSLPNGSRCRSGPRNYDQSDGPIPFIVIPPPTKTNSRPVKHVSLPSGGSGGAAIVGTSFLVTGKDSMDEDIDDSNPDINTGTEISVGFESFIPGGDTNIY